MVRGEAADSAEQPGGVAILGPCSNRYLHRGTIYEAEPVAASQMRDLSIHHLRGFLRQLQCSYGIRLPLPAVAGYPA